MEPAVDLSISRVVPGTSGTLAKEIDRVTAALLSQTEPSSNQPVERFPAGIPPAAKKLACMVLVDPACVPEAVVVATENNALSAAEGAEVGVALGLVDGAEVGAALGLADGSFVVPAFVGPRLGEEDGAKLGDSVVEAVAAAASWD